MIELYQFIAFILGLIAILYSILRFRDGKMSIGMLLLWIVLWVVIIIIAIYPNDTNILANFTGIGRGLDFILILGILLCFYLIFKMYNKIENIEEELTDLVRELAIQIKNTGIKKEEKILNPSNIENPKK